MRQIRSMRFKRRVRSSQILACVRGLSARRRPAAFKRYQWALMLAFIGSVTAVRAEPLRVLEETAIPYMSFLSKADFDQRYPGELVEDPAKLDAGWYVIYQHESLNYYYGPILLQSIGEDYLSQLRETVEAAVAQRPSIQDYRLELSYEPSVASAEASDVEPSTDPASSQPLPAPPPKPSFWSFVKSIFGF